MTQTQTNMKDQLKIFFNKIDQLNKDYSDYTYEGADRFWSHSYTRQEYKSKVKPYKVNKLLNRGTMLVNGHIPHETLIFWRDSPKGGEQEFFEGSEIKKIIHSHDGYDFCLVRTRDMVEPPTRTRWCCAFIGREGNDHYREQYALMKGDEVIYCNWKKWEFEQRVIAGNFDEDQLFEATPSNYFRSHNPFKMITLNWADDKHKIAELSDKLGMTFYAPDEIINEFIVHHDQKNTNDLWITFLIGIKWNWMDSWVKHNATWWGTFSNTKPSDDELIHNVLTEIDWYRSYGDNIQDVLTQRREEGYDINNIDFHKEERIRHMMSDRLPMSIIDVFDAGQHQHSQMKYFLKGYYDWVGEDY